MKNRMKRYFALFLSVLMIFSLAGCGKKTEEKTEDKLDYVYVPEITDMGETNYISNCCYLDGQLYYLSGSWDEVTSVYTTTLKKYDIATGTATEYPLTLEKNAYVNNMCLNQNNQLCIMQNITEYDQDTYETTRNEYYLVTTDLEGNELSKVDVTEIATKSSDGYSYIDTMRIDSNGNIFFKMGENSVVVADSEGKELFTVNTENYANDMSFTKDGKIIVTYYAVAGAGYCASVIDVDKKGFGDKYTGFPSTNSNNSIIPGVESDLVINTGSDLVMYNLANNETKTIVNWVDCDIDSSNVGYIFIDADGNYNAIVNQRGEEDASCLLVKLVKTDASKVVVKETLVYGCVYIADTVKEEIIKFNQTNSQYRIKIKEYLSNDTEYEDAIAAMNNDIASGNAPDLIDLSALKDIESYAEKGLFADLNKYFENDPQISKSDFVSSIIDLYTYNDCLYGVMTGYSINSLIGKQSIVGTDTSWTFQDMINKWSASGCESFMDWATKEGILYTLLMNDLDSYIDTSAGTCDFNNPQFIEILKFTDNFPKETAYDEDAESGASMFRNGKQFIFSANISEFSSFMMYKGLAIDPVTFMGFPAMSGTGISVSPIDGALAISSTCANPDAAWEFIKAILTGSTQTSRWYGFPVLKSALDEMLTDAMTPDTYTDEDGNVIESTSKGSWGYDNIDIDIPVASQADVDQFLELLNRVDSISYSSYNSEVSAMISEEVGAYFDGTKTAEDVADIIQSRVNLYINESK